MTLVDDVSLYIFSTMVFENVHIMFMLLSRRFYMATTRTLFFS